MDNTSGQTHWMCQVGERNSATVITKPFAGEHAARLREMGYGPVTVGREYAPGRFELVDGNGFVVGSCLAGGGKPAPPRRRGPRMGWLVAQ